MDLHHSPQPSFATRPPVRPRAAARTLLAGVALAMLACGDSATEPDVPAGQDPGTLVVTVATTGVRLDPNGYTVAVNGGAATAVAINGSQTFSVPAGTASVVLGDVSVECASEVGTRSVGGRITAEATITSGATQTLSVGLVCHPKDLVYLRVDNDGPHELRVMSTDGTGSVPLVVAEWLWTPRWSPDGTRIAYVKDAGNANLQIFVIDADGTDDHVICCDAVTGLNWDESPSWSPDGLSIVMSRTRDDPADGGIWTMDADGGNQTQIYAGDAGIPDWGPDGRIVYARFTDPMAERPWDIYLMDADGGSQTLLAAEVSIGNPQPRWSPDGLQILFQSDFSGGATTVWSVSAGGGTPVQRSGEALEAYPSWSPDGSQIVFEYWASYPWPPTTHGLCIGEPEGTTCTRITTNTGSVFFDVNPDWRETPGLQAGQ